MINEKTIPMKGSIIYQIEWSFLTKVDRQEYDVIVWREQDGGLASGF